MNQKIISTFSILEYIFQKPKISPIFSKIITDKKFPRSFIKEVSYKNETLSAWILRVI